MQVDQIIIQKSRHIWQQSRRLHLTDESTRWLVILLTALLTISTGVMIWMACRETPVEERLIVKIVPEKRPEYIDLLTASLVVPAEVGAKAPVDEWLRVIQVAENRALETGRATHEEFRAKGYNSKTKKSAYMFSPLEGKGPRIDKTNLPKYAEIMGKADQAFRTHRRPFSATHFYAPSVVTPKWANKYKTVEKSGGHVYLDDGGEAAYRKAKVPDYITVVLPEGRKVRVAKKKAPEQKAKVLPKIKDVDPAQCRINKIVSKIRGQ